MSADLATPLIGIVDDDGLFRETLCGNLVDAGYGIRAWPDGEAFLADIAQGIRPDLILLDWKMPGLNGIDVLRRMRADGIALPVVFLTVLGDQMFEEAALTGGAVDFIEKARSFAIVDRRIRLILDRAAAPPPQAGSDATPGEIRLGELTVDDKCRRAYWRGRLVDLTVTEYAMVALLAARGGKDVSYRDLYDAGHGRGFHAGAGADGYRTNVRAAVKRIREKFKAVDGAFDAIGNYPGFGYAWVADDGAGG
jgi:two-component system response regulator ChvI